MTPTAHGFVGRERGRRRRMLLEVRLIALLLELRPQCEHGGTVKRAGGDTSRLESTSIEAWTVVIVALTDDFAAADDNAAVAVVHGRLRGLLEAESKVIVRLHCDFVGGSWCVVE